MTKLLSNFAVHLQMLQLKLQINHQLSRQEIRYMYLAIQKESLIQSLIPLSKILMTMERAFVELATKEVNLVPVVAESLMKMVN